MDTDGDGLLDHWEEYGIDFNGDGVVDLNFGQPSIRRVRRRTLAKTCMSK